MRFWLFLVLAFVVILAACDSEDEVLPSASVGAQSPSTTETVSSTETGHLSSSPSATEATPTSSWSTYEHPSAGFSFQYPADWSLQDYATEPKVRIASFNLEGWTMSQYPPGGIVIDLLRLPASQVKPRPSDAADATLGGLPGWMRTQPGGGDGDGPWAKSVTYAAISGDYSYSLIAAFEDAGADESTASAVAESFVVQASQ